MSCGGGISSKLTEAFSRDEESLKFNKGAGGGWNGNTRRVRHLCSHLDYRIVGIEILRPEVRLNAPRPGSNPRPSNRFAK
jgi:hypothetical protein